MSTERMLVHSSGKSWDHEYCWVEIGPQTEPRIAPEAKTFLKRFELGFDRPAFAISRDNSKSTFTISITGLASTNQPNRDGRIVNSLIYPELSEAEARALGCALVNHWHDIESAVDQAVVFDNRFQAGFRVDVALLNEVVSQAQRGGDLGVEQRPERSQTRKLKSSELATLLSEMRLSAGFQSVVCLKSGNDWEIELRASPAFSAGRDTAPPITTPPSPPKGKSRPGAVLTRNIQVVSLVIAAVAVGYLIARAANPGIEKKKSW